jgi:hypothetical protein
MSPDFCSRGKVIQTAVADPQQTQNRSSAERVDKMQAIQFNRQQAKRQADGVMRMARLSALEDEMHAAVVATGEPAAACVAETVSGDLDDHDGDSDDTAGEKRAEADLNEIDICGDDDLTGEAVLSALMK